MPEFDTGGRKAADIGHKDSVLSPIPKVSSNSIAGIIDVFPAVT